MEKKGDQMKREINIKQDENKPLPVEVMAESIKQISNAIVKMRSSRLNDKALCLLISHACAGTYHNPKPSPTVVKTVLEGINSLERTFLRTTR